MMAQLTKEITRLKTAVLYEDIITKMEYKDGEVRSYLERQHYLLLEDFCCAAHWQQNYAAMGRTAYYAAWGRLLCVADVLSGQGTAIGFILKTQVSWVAGRKKIRVRKLSFLIFLSNLLLFNRITKKIMRQKNGKFLLTKYIV